MAGVLNDEGLSLAIASFLDRRGLLRLPATSEFHHRLLDGPRGSLLWRGLYHRHWPRGWVAEAEKVAASCPSRHWKVLYHERFFETHNAIVPPVNSFISATRGPMSPWDAIEYVGMEEGKLVTRDLTPADEDLILYNGYTFVLKGSEWPPGGEEVDDCAGLEEALGPMPQLLSESDEIPWEAIEELQEVEVFGACQRTLHAFKLAGRMLG